MKIWLSKNSEVPIREQIIAQIGVGIVGGDLAPGDRLPSTQEIARRYSIHANTVGSAYRELASRGLAEFRKGSGFYVRIIEIDLLEPRLKIEKLISDTLKTAEALGLSARDLINRLEQRLAVPTPKTLVVIENDEELRSILIAEIAAVTEFEVAGINFEEFTSTSQSAAAIFAAMNAEKTKIDPLLHGSLRCHYLGFRSVSESLSGQPRPSETELIAIVSGWPTFVNLARTMLVAAGIGPETLIIRPTANSESADGLGSASIIVSDYAASQQFGPDPRLQIFHLISDSSLQELRNLADSAPEPAAVHA